MPIKVISPQTALARYLKDNKHIFSFDKIIVSKKNKTVDVYRSYFYRHGMNSTNFGINLRDLIIHQINQNLVPGVRSVVIHSYDDQWKAWPGTSYFIVRFTVN